MSDSATNNSNKMESSSSASPSTGSPKSDASSGSRGLSSESQPSQQQRRAESARPSSRVASRSQSPSGKSAGVRASSAEILRAVVRAKDMVKRGLNNTKISTISGQVISGYSEGGSQMGAGNHSQPASELEPTSQRENMMPGSQLGSQVESTNNMSDGKYSNFESSGMHMMGESMNMLGSSYYLGVPSQMPNSQMPKSTIPSSFQYGQIPSDLRSQMQSQIPSQMQSQGPVSGIPGSQPLSQGPAPDFRGEYPVVTYNTNDYPGSNRSFGGEYPASMHQSSPGSEHVPASAAEILSGLQAYAEEVANSGAQYRANTQSHHLENLQAPTSGLSNGGGLNPSSLNALPQIPVTGIIGGNAGSNHGSLLSQHNSNHVSTPNTPTAMEMMFAGLGNPEEHYPVPQSSGSAHRSRHNSKGGRSSSNAHSLSNGKSTKASKRLNASGLTPTKLFSSATKESDTPKPAGKNIHERCGSSDSIKAALESGRKQSEHAKSPRQPMPHSLFSPRKSNESAEKAESSASSSEKKEASPEVKDSEKKPAAEEAAAVREEKEIKEKKEDPDSKQTATQKSTKLHSTLHSTSPTLNSTLGPADLMGSLAEELASDADGGLGTSAVSDADRLDALIQGHPNLKELRPMLAQGKAADVLNVIEGLSEEERFSKKGDLTKWMKLYIDSKKSKADEENKSSSGSSTAKADEKPSSTSGRTSSSDRKSTSSSDRKSTSGHKSSSSKPSSTRIPTHLAANDLKNFPGNYHKAQLSTVAEMSNEEQGSVTCDKLIKAGKSATVACGNSTELANETVTDVVDTLHAWLHGFHDYSSGGPDGGSGQKSVDVRTVVAGAAAISAQAKGVAATPEQRKWNEKIQKQSRSGSRSSQMSPHHSMPQSASQSMSSMMPQSASFSMPQSGLQSSSQAVPQSSASMPVSGASIGLSLANLKSLDESVTRNEISHTASRMIDASCKAAKEKKARSTPVTGESWVAKELAKENSKERSKEEPESEMKIKDGEKAKLEIGAAKMESSDAGSADKKKEKESADNGQDKNNTSSLSDESAEPSYGSNNSNSSTSNVTNLTYGSAGKESNSSSNSSKTFEINRKNMGSQVFTPNSKINWDAEEMRKMARSNDKKQTENKLISEMLSSSEVSISPGSASSSGDKNEKNAAASGENSESADPSNTKNSSSNKNPVTSADWVPVPEPGFSTPRKTTHSRQNTSSSNTSSIASVCSSQAQVAQLAAQVSDSLGGNRGNNNNVDATNTHGTHGTNSHGTHGTHSNATKNHNIVTDSAGNIIPHGGLIEHPGNMEVSPPQMHSPVLSPGSGFPGMMISPGLTPGLSLSIQSPSDAFGSCTKTSDGSLVIGSQFQSGVDTAEICGNSRTINSAGSCRSINSSGSTLPVPFPKKSRSEGNANTLSSTMSTISSSAKVSASKTPGSARKKPSERASERPTQAILADPTSYLNQVAGSPGSPRNPNEPSSGTSSTNSAATNTNVVLFMLGRNGEFELLLRLFHKLILEEIEAHSKTWEAVTDVARKKKGGNKTDDSQKEGSSDEEKKVSDDAETKDSEKKEDAPVFEITDEDLLTLFRESPEDLKDIDFSQCWIDTKGAACAVQACHQLNLPEELQKIVKLMDKVDDFPR